MDYIEVVFPIIKYNSQGKLGNISNGSKMKIHYQNLWNSSKAVLRWKLTALRN